MTTEYDARSPAPGVHVPPVIGRPVKGLSSMQMKAWRRTIPDYKKGGPVGRRGCTLLQKESKPHQVAKHAKSPRRPHNRVFIKRIPDVDPLHYYQRDLKRCNRTCLHAMLGKVHTQSWELLRAQFLNTYPDKVDVIEQMERRNTGIAKAN